MPRQLDPIIDDVLKTFGYDARAVWDCHGTWVVLHKVLEQIAAKAGIRFDLPQIIRAERDEAVILVAGALGDKREWSFGEALIGGNYKVAGKQASYVYAMAEKRAKDRVILKLIGLHGLAYSEEEADEFKGGNGSAPQPEHQPEQPPKITAADEYVAKAQSTIQALGNKGALETWWNNGKVKRREAGLSQQQCDQLKAAVQARVAAVAPQAAPSQPVKPAPEAVAA